MNSIQNYGMINYQIKFKGNHSGIITKPLQSAIEHFSHLIENASKEINKIRDEGFVKGSYKVNRALLKEVNDWQLMSSGIMRDFNIGKITDEEAQKRLNAAASLIKGAMRDINNEHSFWFVM